MGVFEGGQMELKKAVDDLRDAFGPNDYSLIKKNCNHFASALVYRLLGKNAVPGYVNRIADVGACCACLLPRQMLENAPVGDPNAANNNGGFGGNSGIIARGPSAPQSNSMRAFSGAGAKLGGGPTANTAESGGLMGSLLSSNGATSSNNSKATDDLTDRREKARKAALARLEKQQQQSISNESKDK
ncbi:Desumoylating isopeptidase [Seminavis robusta]|uniref:Desumoylating isopeptidase n=1 Tax=Seminavis robusta TaxID=568900 RepID=A0A9N8I153_9STRA|nr:Desumoylating isopeptidase [Seminavis robusta]|eukprot:Sro3128_g344320.1 Desumoylating isopeptidase (187) ;mRNA; r:7737-8297